MFLSLNMSASGPGFFPPEVKEECPVDPIPGIEFLQSEDSLYIDKAIRGIAQHTQSRPDWIIATIMIESGFNPHATNDSTSAYGLIQFMPGTLASMGITKHEIESAGIQQMEYVSQYFLQIAKIFGKLDTPTKTYLAVFYPVAIDKGPDYRIGGPVTYRQNRGLDMNHDGILTRLDITHKIENVLSNL